MILLMINYKPKKKNNNKPYDNKCAIEKEMDKK